MKVINKRNVFKGWWAAICGAAIWGVAFQGAAYQKIAKNISRFVSFVIWLSKQVFNLIFPESPETEILESLSPCEIYERCQKCREGDLVRLEKLFSCEMSAIFSYKDPLVKEMIWLIKFRGQKKYAGICGDFLYKAIQEKMGGAAKKHLLIPVPIHKKRRKERGFNQCEWLCEQIIKAHMNDGGNSKNENESNDPGEIFLEYCPDLITREIYREKQSWGNRSARIENMRGVFKINSPEKICGISGSNEKSDGDSGASIGGASIGGASIGGSSVILIDDVITTGATLSELVKILKVAGAKEIWIFTIAH